MYVSFSSSQISEKSLKSQTDQLRSDIGTLHSHLLEKDKDVSRVRAESDRKLKDVHRQTATLEDELWQEKRKLASLSESLRQEKETVQQMQEKEAEVRIPITHFVKNPPWVCWRFICWVFSSQFVRVKNRLQQDIAAQSSAHQQIMDDVKRNMTALKTRNDQLEEEKKLDEQSRSELEEGKCSVLWLIDSLYYHRVARLIAWLTDFFSICCSLIDRLIDWLIVFYHSVSFDWLVD